MLVSDMRRSTLRPDFVTCGERHLDSTHSESYFGSPRRELYSNAGRHLVRLDQELPSTNEGPSGVGLIEPLTSVGYSFRQRAGSEMIIYRVLCLPHLTSSPQA
jgi:hypothetical protein